MGEATAAVFEKREVGFSKDDSKKVGRFIKFPPQGVFFFMVLYGVTYELSAGHTPKNTIPKNEK
jgi:hypothetical protein